MRLLCFSDWRVQPIEEIYRFVRNLRELPDFILYAGDDLGRFFEEGTNHFTELADYTKQKKVLAVAGNDDLVDIKFVLNSQNVYDLYTSSFIHEQFAFFGIEASTSGPGLLKHSEKEIKQHLKRQSLNIKDKEIIILSHTPPHGTLDLGIRFAKIEEGPNHIGSTALRDFILDNPVKLVVCGHCHSQGKLTSDLGETKVVNIASHDSYGAFGNFALIEIDSSGSLSVEFHDTSEQISPDSLLNLHGVGPVTEFKLGKIGIETIEQLINVGDLYEISDSSGIPISTVRQLKAKAKSFCEKRPFQIEKFAPISGELIFFDIETDIACQKVWLIGTYKNGQFIQFYANTWAEERKILSEFLDLLKRCPKSKLVSFSGTNFDKRVVENALRRLKLDFHSFLSHTHIDLYQELRKCFIFPIQSYGLKSLASFLRYEFKHSEFDGLMIALEYHRHIQDGTPINQKVFEYNEDDVKAVSFIMKKMGAIVDIQKSSIHELVISQKQIEFRSFVEELKRKGITGAQYREEVAKWNREHLEV